MNTTHIVNAEDITNYIEGLEAESLKASLKIVEDHFIDKGEPVPDVYRRSNTVQGFLTKEKLEEMFANPDPDQLLIRSGLVFISDRKVFFLSDVHGFGHNILPSSFISCSISNLHHFVGEGMKYKTVDDILAQYCYDERHLNSLEELAKYALTGE